MEWLSANTCVCSNHAICFDDMLGYNEMLCRIKPSKIICYGKHFDEMKGDIIEVDYAKTNNLQKSNSSLYIKTFCGYVDNTYRKGGGSASGQNSGNPELTNTLPVKSKPNSKLVRYYNGKKFKKDIMMKTEKQKWILITQITVTLNDILMCLISICG